jgi:hypothetical protein
MNEGGSFCTFGAGNAGYRRLFGVFTSFPASETISCRSFMNKPVYSTFVLPLWY